MKSWLSKTSGYAAALGAVVMLSIATLGSSPTMAQEVTFKGQTINVVVRSAPGGGNDIYGRLVARHIVKYLPGNPNSIVTNMPGGGGLVAANYIATRAKKDGTEIGILDRDLAVTQRLGATGVQYDVRTLIPIGSAGAETYIWVTHKDYPVKDLRDLKGRKETMRFSGTGAGTNSVQQVLLVKSDGFPVDVVTGYSGTAEKVLAVLRGDVQGTSGTYESMLPAIQNEGMRVFSRLGPLPDLMDVPDLRDVLSEEKRPIAALMAAPLVAARPFYTAPGVPEARVKVLREAFQKALQDPELLEEAKRAQQSIHWVSGEDLHKNNLEILEASDEVVAAFKAM
jgi:tripartite-type tricarboxylate transporter receptor subunit TctC